MLEEKDHILGKSSVDIASGNLTHSHGKWPIEIDGLPIKNGDFPWLC
jgi:hypothetical protein